MVAERVPEAQPLSVNVSAVELRRALTQLKGAVATRKTASCLPILANVHIAPCALGIRLSATDLKIGHSIVVCCHWAYGDAITVNLVDLLKAATAAGKDTMTLTMDDGKLTCAAHAITTILPTIDADEYPIIPQASSMERIGSVKANSLRDALRLSIHAASTDTTRGVLTGMYWQMDKGSLRITCSDAYRLATIPGIPVAGLAGPTQLLIPATSCAHLLRTLPDDASTVVLYTTASRGQIALATESSEWVATLLSEQFINYLQIVPKHEEVRFTVTARHLLDAITAVASKDVPDIFLHHIPGAGLRVHQHDDSASVVISITSHTTGPLTIGFNPDYLADICKVIGKGTLTLAGKGSTHAALITTSSRIGAQWVLMPVTRPK